MNLQVNIKDLSFGNQNIFLNLEYKFIFNNLYVIRGENGSGKSTLFSILSGRNKNFRGCIQLNGIKITSENYNNYTDNYVSYVYQNSLIFDDATCLENIYYPYSYKDKNKAIEILNKLKLDKVINSKANCLSSGEKQRLAFGRILYDLKPIVILDEITSNLDSESKMIVEEIINEISLSHLVIISSHESIKNLNNYVELKIEDKKLVEVSKKEKFKLEGENNTQIIIKKDSSFSDCLSFIKRDKKFYIINSISLFFIMLFVMIIGSFVNINSQDNIYKYCLDDFLANSPAFRFTKKGLSYEKYINEKDYSSTNFDFCMLINKNDGYEAGNLLSGLSCYTDINELNKNVSLIEGKLPTNETEILISSVCYQHYLKTYSKSEVFSLDVFYPAIGTFKICGVYQANNDNLKQLENRYQESVIDQNKSFVIFNETRICFAYNVETVYTFTDNPSSEFAQTNSFLLRNSYRNSKIYLDAINSKQISYPNSVIFRSDDESYHYSPLFIDKSGKYILPNSTFNFVQYPLALESFACFFGFYLLIYIVLIISYFIQNSRKFLLLRVTGMSQKRQVFAGVFSLIISSIIPFISALILGSISPIFINMYYENIVLGNLIIDVAKFNYVLFMLSIVIYLLTILAIFLVMYFGLSPKDISKKLNELKRK